MIREITESDGEQLTKIIERINEFTKEEKETAVELINESIKKNIEDNYITYVYLTDNAIAGYYCIGKRALTDGVYDLFWIVVDPDKQETGIGKKLLNHAEEYVVENNGRWLLIETSSKDNYSKTRNFYLRNFFTKVAEINDFYKIDDHLIVFGKYLKT